MQTLEWNKSLRLIVDLSDDEQTRTLIEKGLQCTQCKPTWLELPVQFSGMSQLFTASLHTTPMNSIYGGHHGQKTVAYVKQRRERERTGSCIIRPPPPV